MTFDRTFTLHEAQDLLPTLDGILQSAMRAHREIEDIDQELQTLISHILLAGGMQVDPIRTNRLRADRGRHAQHLDDALREIAATGVQLKDIDQGLLDFPSLLHGKVVLLCWKAGEPAIEHWHGTEEGYANRKPLDPAMYRGGTSQRVN